MYLKYLKITGEGVDSQGKFAYATCDEIQPDTCPYCHSQEVYVHGYYYRNPSAKGRDGARKRLRIKVKRYKCRCCGKTHTQDLNHIGLAKYQRRNARLNDAISRECANGVCNKKIGEKYRISTSTVERQLHPAIQTAHEFKEELCALLNIEGINKTACVPLLARLKEMVRQMHQEAPEIFKKLGRTIRQWFEPIIRMWRFTKSNGITEGFHRKNEINSTPRLWLS